MARIAKAAAASAAAVAAVAADRERGPRPEGADTGAAARGGGRREADAANSSRSTDGAHADNGQQNGQPNGQRR